MILSKSLIPARLDMKLSYLSHQREMDALSCASRRIRWVEGRRRQSILLFSQTCPMWSRSRASSRAAAGQQPLSPSPPCPATSSVTEQWREVGQHLQYNDRGHQGCGKRNQGSTTSGGTCAAISEGATSMRPVDKGGGRGDEGEGSSAAGVVFVNGMGGGGGCRTYPPGPACGEGREAELSPLLE